MLGLQRCWLWLYQTGPLPAEYPLRAPWPWMNLIIAVAKFAIVNSLREFKVVIRIPSVVIKMTVQNCYMSIAVMISRLLHVWLLQWSTWKTIPVQFLLQIWRLGGLLTRFACSHTLQCLLLTAYPSTFPVWEPIIVEWPIRKLQNIRRWMSVFVSIML